jgi:hypothetical protein
MDLEHIRSGRFIHIELLRRAEHSVAKIPDLWRADFRIYPSMLIWPTDGVQTQNGGQHTGVIFTALPNGADDRSKMIKLAVENCDAYALLVIEEVEGAVRAIFESAHGTETWRLPIKDHGGVRVLGVAARSTNTESLGVLWHAN